MGRRLLAVALCLAVLAPSLAACGGSSLEEPAPCTAPTPTPRARPGESSSNFQYTQRIDAGVKRLTDLLTTFRAAWPNGTFYRTGTFRQDFVNYAGRAVCLANDLAALAPPQGQFQDFATTWPPLMEEYAAVAQRGLEAVRTRNTSDYRKWGEDVDALEGRVAAAVQALVAAR
jgi:hypothetical protein